MKPLLLAVSLLWATMTSSVMMLAAAGMRRRAPSFVAPLHRRQSIRSLTAPVARAIFEEGDEVNVSTKRGQLLGRIQESRGGGWYAVQVDGSSTIGKFRSSQLELVPLSKETSSTKASLPHLDVQEITPPTIVDLDAAIRGQDTTTLDSDYLQQLSHHASVTKWVMFTDLHCASSTIDTCVEVLDTVHRLAVEREAGVLFLGDWWHHRGTIRVNTLNSILEALGRWTVPMVMIPGNHDQTTLDGHEHGLTPLENAYRCHDGTLPGPLIFSHPTVFARGLFVPHIRDVAVMESVLRSTEAKDAASLFVHADVTGASMNDLVVSQGGVLPSVFPPHKPIYSGHFHKPHFVNSTHGATIEYVGSPYETSLSEAQQDKYLLVLDASKDWDCVERIPLRLGRRHFRVFSADEFLQCRLDGTESLRDNPVRPGDRVVVSIGKEDLERNRRSAVNGDLCAFDAHTEVLRQAGVSVEVREVKPVATEAMGNGNVEDKSKLEELTPEATLASYLDEEVRRETLSNVTAQQLLTTGLELLEDMESDNETLSITEQRNTTTELRLEAVHVQGFGPFKDLISYPLLDRGLVLVQGSNKDGGSDSNGSGKSTLAMAALWALTGATDPRPMHDAKVSAIVNDDCKVGKVTLSGLLNGEPFSITRAKSQTKTALMFALGKEDLTTQSVKETQEVIEERLGVDSQVLARTMFQGQHTMNGLLESTDTKLKDELSLLVPLSLWQDAATRARTKSRNASKRVSELKGMVSLRTDDLKKLEEKQRAAANTAESKRAELVKRRRALEEEAKKALAAQGQDLPTLQSEVENATREVNKLDERLEEMIQVRDDEIRKGEEASRKLALVVEATKQEVMSLQRDYDRAVMGLESGEAKLQDIRLKWGLETGKALETAQVESPESCPTCGQSITGDGGHSPEEMKEMIQEELDAATEFQQEAAERVRQSKERLEEVNNTLQKEERNLAYKCEDVDEIRDVWKERIAVVREDVMAAKKSLADANQAFTKSAAMLQQSMDATNKMAQFKLAQQSVQADEEKAQELQNEVTTTESALAELRAKAEEQRALSTTYSDLTDCFGPKGIQAFVLQHAVEALQTTTQDYLNELSDGSLKLELELDAGDKISRSAHIRAPDGSYMERPLSSLSGGQWRRFSIALNLGFVDLVARRGRMRPSLLVLDEPLTHLDRSGRTNVGKLLKRILRHSAGPLDTVSSGIAASTVLLILQDLAAEELEECFDHVDEVIREGGYSRVLVDEGS